MLRKHAPFSLCIFISIVLMVPVVAGSRSSTQNPVPKLIQLDSKGQDYVQVLGGPPETMTMRSGLITLAPKKSVGKHNTENYEELVIILEGQAEMIISGGETLRLSRGSAAYCPPQKEHDVLNVGSGLLQYIYVVAQTKR